jgi:cytochrome c-type biogenesis protein CcmH/NrfF
MHARRAASQPPAISSNRSEPLPDALLPLLRLPVVLFCALLCFPVTAAAVTQEQLQVVTEAILCDCGCHPQSVHSCACGRADEMEAMIGDRMEREGLDGVAMLKLWIEENGEASLLVPKAKGFSLVAWLGPVLALPLALFGLFLLLKRAREPGTAGSEHGKTTNKTEIDPAAMERLRLAREEWER